MSFDPNTNPYQSPMAGTAPAAYAEETERAAFIRRTYTHLAGALLALVGIEFILFNVLDRAQMVAWVQNPTILIITLLGCIGVGWVADIWARSGSSPQLQYLGLGLCVSLEALFLAPFLFLATIVGAEIIPTAAIMTGIIFGGLTLMVWVTKADFSWLRGILVACSLGVFGLMICSWVFGGFTLGLGFTVFMIVLMSGFILYETSAIMREYHTDMHVAAALALFTSVIILFRQILILLIRMSGDD